MIYLKNVATLRLYPENCTGCAQPIIYGMLTGNEPSCDCGGPSSGGWC